MGRRSPIGQQSHHHMPPMTGNLSHEHEQFGQQRGYGRGTDPLLDMPQPLPQDHWRNYQSDSRRLPPHMMPPYQQRDRHMPHQLGPGQSLPPPQQAQQQQQQQQMHNPLPSIHPMPHYGAKIDIPPSNGRPQQMPTYYQHNNLYAQQQSMMPHQQGPPQPIGPDGVPISMRMHHQRRPSPKYDRHGNPIRNMPIHMSGTSMPRNFMSPGGSMDNHLPMMHPGGGGGGGGGAMGPYGNNGQTFAQRWHHNDNQIMPNCPADNLPGLGALQPLGPTIQQQQQQPPYAAIPPMQPVRHRTMLHDERFLEPHRYHQLSRDMMFNHNQMNHHHQQQQNQSLAANGQPDAPRYTKWRERRDVITNLDRQTAQSSSRTDSLKSSLQQQIDFKTKKQQQHPAQAMATNQAQSQSKQTPKQVVKKDDSSNGAKKVKRSEQTKTTDPQDISDGEIVDDESSDDDDINNSTSKSLTAQSEETTANTTASKSGAKIANSRGAPDASLHDGLSNKRRRIGGDAEMNYETISDEELDDFMSERKELDGKAGSLVGKKSSSEMELLNALGLDWANLVEMSKQTKKEANTSSSALRRFSMANYLPTLGITKELAGSEIFELVTKICH